MTHTNEPPGFPGRFKVAFLSHDILWGMDLECTAFEECVARSTLDLDTFWSRALADDDFPVDFVGAGGVLI